MGTTVPSFQIVLAEEKAEWKPFRNALDKSERKKFDEMWDIPRFYISACSNSVQYVRLHPIQMSILIYDYKELTRCIKEVERIEAKLKGISRQKIREEEKHEGYLQLPLPPLPPRQLKLSEF